MAAFAIYAGLLRHGFIQEPVFVAFRKSGATSQISREAYNIFLNEMTFWEEDGLSHYWKDFLGATNNDGFALPFLRESPSRCYICLCNF
jgi:hypothetical protein